LGLTFNHETEDADFSTVGQVNVTRLDHYYVDNGMNSEPTGWQEDYMSHLYGESQHPIAQFPVCGGDISFSDKINSDLRIPQIRLHRLRSPRPRRKLENLRRHSPRLQQNQHQACQLL
jgi:hypothetical protein